MIDTSGWKEFRVGELFELRRGMTLPLTNLDEGKTPVVSASQENEGINFYCNLEPTWVNKITISMNGVGTGFTCYHNYPFVANSDCCVLVEKNFVMTPGIGLFLSTIINQIRYKYSYGRKSSAERLQGEIIKIPATPSGEPDWQYMEDFMKDLNCEPITTSITPSHLPLEVEKWEEFRIGDYFDIHPTKAVQDLSKTDVGDSGTPLVVNSAENNGIGGYINMPPTEKGGIITFSDTTEGNTFFYQPDDFIGFAHVQGMYPKTRIWNCYEMLFLCCVLMYDSIGLYNYGRKMTRETIIERRIKLPTTSSKIPDWKFMENYVKSLAYSDRIGDNPVGSRITDHGSRITDHGSRITDHGSRITDHGSRTPAVFDEILISLIREHGLGRNLKLKPETWKEFRVGDMFDVLLSKGDIKADEVESGDIPLVSSGQTDNGIVAYVSKDGDGKAEIFHGNVITVDMFCNPFYQPTDFYAVSHGRVNVLVPKFNMSPTIGLFICSLIKKEQYKYSYGRALYSDEITNMLIRLPITCGNSPDWQWMENYMQSLPYSDRIVP